MKSACYCTQLRMATRRLAAEYDAALAPLGINVAQFSLMRMIGRSQPVSLTELGNIAALDRSTIGRNVRVLERMGLISSGRGQDRREAVIMLAESGTRLLDEAAPLWEGCQRSIEERLGSDALQALGDILHAI